MRRTAASLPTCIDQFRRRRTIRAVAVALAAAAAVLILSGTSIFVSLSTAVSSSGDPPLGSDQILGGPPNAVHEPETSGVAAPSPGNSAAEDEAKITSVHRNGGAGSRGSAEEPRRSVHQTGAAKEPSGSAPDGGHDTIAATVAPRAASVFFNYSFGGGVFDASTPLPPPPPVGERFPPFGTDAFRRRCGWALAARRPAARTAGGGGNGTAAGGNCTLLVRPHNESGEGIAQWTSSIVSAHLHAVQIGCALRIDYGVGLDVARVLVPPSSRLRPPPSPHDANAIDGANSAEQDGSTAGLATAAPPTLWEASTPPEAPCLARTGCWRGPDVSLRGQPSWHADDPIEPYPLANIPVPNVPSYRYAFNKRLSRGAYERSLSSALGMGDSATSGGGGGGGGGQGFDLRYGAACSLNSLFALAPSAAEYVPGLFERILPALRHSTDDESSAVLTTPVAAASAALSSSPPPPLVLALYVRTGWTDRTATAQEKGKRAGKDKGTLGRSIAANVVRCALLLEESHRRAHIATAAASFSSAPANEEGQEAGGGEERRHEVPLLPPPSMPSRVVWMIVTDSAASGRALAAEHGSAPHRTVLTTGARGAHSRPTREPDTTDFAQAVVDWYALGESDAVVTSGKGGSHLGYSFPFMGALRTVRPLYDASDGKCTRRVMVRS